MMKKIIRAAFVLLFAVVSPVLQAQQEVEMADALRSEGKIYVVVAILLVIFAGIVAYLFSIDRKVSRLEKRVQDKNSKMF
jgi:CcmD family protein